MPVTPHLLDTLFEQALALEAAHPSALTARYYPSPTHRGGGLNDGFVIAQLDEEIAGFAFARLGHFSAENGPQHTLTVAQQLALAAENSASPSPAVMATLNAVFAKHRVQQLATLPQPPDTVVEFTAAQDIGMVGYFEPLIAPLRRAGHRIRCVELDRSRWQRQPGLIVGSDSSMLSPCETVLCTGSVLLNNTLPAIRQAAVACRRFVLLGPTVPLAPDALHQHGITHIAGRWVQDTPRFWAACRAAEYWAPYTRKFVLDISTTPSPPAR